MKCKSTMKLHPYRYSNGCQCNDKGNVLLRQKSPPLGCRAARLRRGNLRASARARHKLMMWRRQAGGQWVQQPVQTRRSHAAAMLLCLHLHVTCAPSRVALTSVPACVEVCAGGSARVSSPNWQRQLEEHLPQSPGLMRRNSSAAVCLCSHMHAHLNYRRLGA